jgi:hypothetical protein
LKEGRKIFREVSIGVEGRKMWRAENIKSGCQTVKKITVHTVDYGTTADASSAPGEPGASVPSGAPGEPGAWGRKETTRDRRDAGRCGGGGNGPAAAFGKREEAAAGCRDW